MSEIEMNEAERLNQMLCAYVLGEASDAERVEIENALAKDGALREERARLEATIGLVKSSMGKDETLSYRAASEVTRAAAAMQQPATNGRRGGAWHQSSSLRIAASIVALVGGGYLGWRAFVKSDSAPVVSRGYVATVDKEAPKNERAARAENDRDSRHLRSLGNSSDSSVEYVTSAPAEAQPPAADPAGIEAKRAVEQSLAQRELGLKNLLVPGDPFGPDSAPARADESVYSVTQLRAGEKAGVVSDARSAGLPAQVASKPQGSAPAPGAAVVPQGNPVPTAPMTASAKARVATGGSGGGLTGEQLKTLGYASAEELELSFGFTGSAGSNGDFDWEVEAGELALEDGASVSGGVITLGSAFERVDQLDESKEKKGKDAYLGQSKDDEAREQTRARRVLTPEEREARIEQVLASCRRLPNEKPRDMFFRFWGDNPPEWSANDRQSTFSMDVDTASYTLARKYLVDGKLPEKAQIRTEEFVNYFKPDVAPPSKGTFAIVTELAPSRYSNPIENKWMLRVAVRGVEVPRTERAPLALTFVVDVSGSMKEGGRLELVKHALRQLMTQLDARDSISIVAFSNDSRLILPMTSAAKRDLIESAIDPLQPEQSTNTEAGLRMGYEQALGALTLNATNRVVLLTDGVANVGIKDPNVLVQTVERQRKAGIYLNTIGVGMNNHNDNLLEQLADKGDGLCNYVDDAAEVKHALVDNFLQTLVPIARDAKVQVEFDPAQVESYRLLGYENRAIADQDFRDDKVDAGEINSGHQITALYEIVRTGNLAAQESPLARVNVRFKPPHKDGVASAATEEASEISKPVLAKDAAVSFEATPFGYRRAVLAAQFAEFLRRSVHARGDSLDLLIADMKKLSSENVGDAQVAELSDMVVKSKVLLDRELARRGELDAAVYELRNDCWERAQRETRQREQDREALRMLDEQIKARELALRGLLHERLK